MFAFLSILSTTTNENSIAQPMAPMELDYVVTIASLDVKDLPSTQESNNPITRLIPVVNYSEDYCFNSRCHYHPNSSQDQRYTSC